MTEAEAFWTFAETSTFLLLTEVSQESQLDLMVWIMTGDTWVYHDVSTEFPLKNETLRALYHHLELKRKQELSTPEENSPLVEELQT